MNRYEGLNLPQLLDLMHETVVPEVVSWLPSTPGWWVVLFWVLGAGVLVLRHRVRRHRANRYRREALAALDALQSVDDGALIAALLKRTALAAYPRVQVASLHGEEWARFLVESCNHDPVVQRAAHELARAAYRPVDNPAALVAPARRWIRKHRG